MIGPENRMTGHCTQVNIISDLKISKDEVTRFLSELAGQGNICKIDLIDTATTLNIPNDFLDTDCCKIREHYYNS